MSDNEKDDLAIRVGEQIAAARTKFYYSQGKLGELIGKSANNVANYERGRVLPPLDVLVKIADLTGTTVGILLGEPVFFMAPNRPKRDDEICELIRASAAVARIHACAFVLINGDFTRLDEAEQFTRLVRAFERLPAEFREHLTKIAESYPLVDVERARRCEDQ